MASIQYPWEKQADAQLFVDPSLPASNISSLLNSSVIIGARNPENLGGRSTLFAVWHRATQFRLTGLIHPELNRLVLHRCNDVCLVDLEPGDGKASSLALHWSPTSLNVVLWTASGVPRGVTINTAQTYVPNSLIRLCRDRQWIPEPSYGSPSVLSQTVSEAFEQLSLPLRNASRVLRDGRDPKPEAQLSDLLGELLRHLEPVKKISLQREVQYGSGRVDFVASATTEGGETARVCIEVKRSTHDDLEHGLAVQLPEYMKRAGTDYGLFVVIDFGPGYRPANMAEDGDLRRLAFLADRLNQAQHLQIHVLILDGTPQPQPSKM